MSETTENQKQIYETYEQAEQYIQDVRDLYVDEKYHYQGRRDEDQRDISWFASDTAREIVNTSFLGVMAMGGVDASKAIDHPNKEIMGGYTWGEYREEFENLLENFAVITHRIDKDGIHTNVPSFINLSAADQMRVGMALFADFQDHNARRFGVKTAGIKQTDFKITYPDDGGAPTRVKYAFDPDKAPNDGAIEDNMEERGYRSGIAVHQAGKISVEEYNDLRSRFPTIKKKNFDNYVSAYQRVREHLEEETNL